MKHSKVELLEGYNSWKDEAKVIDINNKLNNNLDNLTTATRLFIGQMYIVKTVVPVNKRIKTYKILSAFIRNYGLDGNVIMSRDEITKCTSVANLQHWIPQLLRIIYYHSKSLQELVDVTVVQYDTPLKVLNALFIPKKEG